MHFPKQAMPRGLIDHLPGQKRIDIVFQCDSHALKPVCPSPTQTLPIASKLDGLLKSEPIMFTHVL
jgi:hypothetical protein